MQENHNGPVAKAIEEIKENVGDLVSLAIVEAHLKLMYIKGYSDAMAHLKPHVEDVLNQTKEMLNETETS